MKAAALVAPPLHTSPAFENATLVRNFPFVPAAADMMTSLVSGRSAEHDDFALQVDVEIGFDLGLIVSIRVRISLAVALPLLRMKLACLREISAPPVSTL